MKGKISKKQKRNKVQDHTLTSTLNLSEVEMSKSEVEKLGVSLKSMKSYQEGSPINLVFGCSISKKSYSEVLFFEYVSSEENEEGYYNQVKCSQVFKKEQVWTFLEKLRLTSKKSYEEIKFVLTELVDGIEEQKELDDDFDDE